MSNPIRTSQPGYFSRYIDQVKEKELTLAFTNQSVVIKDFLSAITEDKSMFAYAEGKWTLKELLQHIIDTERVFAYRALCFARKETTVLPSFDQNEYATASGANSRTWESLVKEFGAVRQSNLLMYQSFTPEMLSNVGEAGGSSLSAEDLGFITIGHFNHHKKIIEERYLAGMEKA